MKSHHNILLARVFFETTSFVSPQHLLTLLIFKMKFRSTILALCLIQAGAFNPPKHQRITTSSTLKSTPFGAGDQGGFFNPNDNSIDNPTSETSGPLSNLNESPIGDGVHSNPKNMARLPPVIVQGRALRTWSFATPSIQRVQVQLKTEGRPLNANIDLWEGPDNCPQKMAVYVEDGSIRPFNSLIETPGGENAVAIRNTATMEYPLYATVEAGIDNSEGTTDAHGRFSDLSQSAIVQGGSIKTYTFGAPVDSIQILLKTDGRPLNARIELLQGPNTNKQVIDLYTENGTLRPFYCIIDTPGSGNVIRIINTAPMEFPLTAAVEPLEVADGFEFGDDGGGNNKHGWDSTNDASFFFLGGR